MWTFPRRKNYEEEEEEEKASFAFLPSFFDHLAFIQGIVCRIPYLTYVLLKKKADLSSFQLGRRKNIQEGGEGKEEGNAGFRRQFPFFRRSRPMLSHTVRSIEGVDRIRSQYTILPSGAERSVRTQRQRERGGGKEDRRYQEDRQMVEDRLGLP